MAELIEDPTVVTLGEVVRTMTRIELSQKEVIKQIGNLDFVRRDVYQAEKETISLALKAVEKDVVDIRTDIAAAQTHTRGWAVAITSTLIVSFVSAIFALHLH